MPWIEIGGFLVVIALAVLGFRQVLNHGEEKAKRKEAEDERDDALKREEQGNAADLTDKQHDSFIDKL